MIIHGAITPLATMITSLGVRPDWSAVAGYTLIGLLAGLAIAFTVARRAARGRPSASGRLGTMTGRHLRLELAGLVAAVTLVAGTVGLSTHSRELFEVSGTVAKVEWGIDMAGYTAYTLKGQDTVLWAEIGGVVPGDWLAMQCTQESDFPDGEWTCWEDS